MPRGNAHVLAAYDVLAAHGASESGLTEAEAAERLAQYRPNHLPTPPGHGQILRFLSHFPNLLTYVLIGSAVVTTGLGHLVDAAVILAVFIGNAVMGFI